MGGKLGDTKSREINSAEKLALELKAALLAGGREKLGMHVEICGSIRRRVQRVGDIDMAVNWDLLESVEILEEWGRRTSTEVIVLSNLDTVKKIVNLSIDGLQIDIYFAWLDQWGAMVLFLTGSRLFNIVMRGKAKKVGYKLNQYGLWHGDEIIAGRTEEQIFFALGMEYVTPEERSISYKRIKKINQKEEMLCQR